MGRMGRSEGVWTPFGGPGRRCSERVIKILRVGAGERHRVWCHDLPHPCGHLPAAVRAHPALHRRRPPVLLRRIRRLPGRLPALPAPPLGRGDPPQPSDRANRLWTLDTATGEERIAADPVALLGGGEEDLSPAEKARRERSREGSAGIVGYSLDGSRRAGRLRPLRPPLHGRPGRRRHRRTARRGPGGRPPPRPGRRPRRLRQHHAASCGSPAPTGRPTGPSHSPTARA